VSQPKLLLEIKLQSTTVLSWIIYVKPGISRSLRYGLLTFEKMRTGEQVKCTCSSSIAFVRERIYGSSGRRIRIFYLEEIQYIRHVASFANAGFFAADAGRAATWEQSDKAYGHGSILARHGLKTGTPRKSKSTARFFCAQEAREKVGDGR